MIGWRKEEERKEERKKERNPIHDLSETDAVVLLAWNLHATAG